MAEQRTPGVVSRYLGRIGERIGHLTFIAISDRMGDGSRVLGVFACDCGRTAVLSASRVLSRTIRDHCGCRTDRGANRTHGMRNSREYSSWQAMIGRCHSPSHKDYPKWGGDGLTVCQEWRTSFSAFFEHIGPRPAGTTLDRIDNRKGYQPGNVRWATPSEQQRNRRSARSWHVKGKDFETADEAAAFFGVSAQTFHRWVKGFHDARRGRFTPAREDCHASARY